MTDYDAGSVSTRLSGDFDRREFDEYEAAVARADNKKATAHLRLDISDLKKESVEAERVMRDWERRRENASKGSEARSTAQYLSAARRRSEALKAEVAERDRALGSLKREGVELTNLTERSRIHSREQRELAKSLRAVGGGADDGGRGVKRLTGFFDGMGRSSRRSHNDVFHLFGLISSFGTKIPIAKILAFGTGITALIPPVVALTSALGPAVGLLGAIPGLAITGIGALVTAGLGLRGIGAAVGKAWGLQTQAANSAIQTGKQALAASRATRNAEQALSDANRSAEDAQVELNDAREEATRRLEDMREATRRARLEEENSTDSLADAREELARLQQVGGTREEISDARRRVKEAELDLADAKKTSQRASQDLNKVEEQGVNRMDEVVAARRALVDATRNVVRQQEDLADATDKANLTLDTGASAASAYQVALANLSPAGRRFVAFVRSDLFPLFKQLRNEAEEGLLPGLERGAKEAERNFPVLERMVRSYSDALGDAAEQQGRFFGRPDVGTDLDQVFGQGERLIRKSAEATTLWERGLIHVAVAAHPLLVWAGDMNVELADMFEHWAEQGRESGRLQAFFRRTINTVEDTVAALWDFGAGLINIGKIARRVWGADMLDGIREAAREFREWTESIRGQRDIEGYFVRWRRRWHEIAGAVKEVFNRYRELRREGEKPFDALTEALAEAFSRALPKIAQNVAHQVPVIVEAFITGFLAADMWGKLLIGGWLLAKFGGARAFLGLGRKAGGFLGLGISEGAAATVAGGAATAEGVGGSIAGGAAAGGLFGSLRAKLLPAARRSGLLAVGLVLGNKLMDGISSRMAARSGDLFKALESEKDPTRVNLGFGKIGLEDIIGKTDMTKAAEDLQRAVRRLADSSKEISPRRAKELRHELELMGDLGPKPRRAINQLIDTAENRFRDGRRATKEWNTAIATMVRDSQGNLAKMSSNVKFNTKLIREALKDDSGKGRKALANNMEAIVDVIKRTMTRGGRITDQGLSLIKRLFVNELRSYGLNPREALAGANVRSGDVAGGFRRQDYGGTGDEGRYGGRRGGMVPVAISPGELLVFPDGSATRVPGSRRRADSVRTELPHGTAVFTDDGQRRMRRGSSFLSALRHQRPHFQGGGIVEEFDPFNDPEGHGGSNSHLHLGFRSPRLAVRMGHILQRLGWLVSEQSHFGGVDPVHVRGSLHYSDRAIDVNWPNAAMEAAKIRALLPLLGFLSRGAARIKRVIVQGRDSPLKTTVQTGLDRVRRRVQKRLDRLTLADPRMAGLSGDGDVERIFAKVARRISTSRVATEALGMAGYTESGMRDLPGGDASSQGSLQLLASTASGMGIDPHNEGQVSSAFLTRGFYGRGGANALAAQGLPPHQVAQSVQGSAFSDGSNYLAMAGRARAWMRRFNLSRGGLVGAAAQSLQGGGFVTGVGNLTKRGTRYRDRHFKVIHTLEDDIEKLGRRYELDSRWADLTDEEFINEGDETTPPSLNQDAIAHRLAELDKLIATRRKITMKYHRLAAYIGQLVRVYNTMKRRLTRSIDSVQAQLKKLKGRKGKEANRMRGTLGDRLATYRGTLSGVNVRLTDLAPRREDALYEEESSRIDLRGLRIERKPLLGRGAGIELPDFEPGGGTGDADQQAIAEQAQAREQAALSEAASLRTALRVFTGSGDLGQGGFTTLQAAVAPTGVPGPGYVVGPTGQLIPVVQAGSAPPSGGAVSGTGDSGGTTIVFQSTLPATRDQARQVGEWATEGIDAQAPTLSSRTEVQF